MKAIASFDMDMTLLDHKTWKIPDSTYRALERLREQYYIVIATGRDMDSKFSLGLKELVGQDAIIHLNGNKITVGERVIFERSMDPGLVKRMLAFAAGKDFALGITTGMEDYYVNPEYVTIHDMTRFGESKRHFKDPEKLLKMPVRSMTYIGKAEAIHALEEAFPEVKLPLFSSREGADVIEKDVSKAEGLRCLCRFYGVSIQDTIAFGDSMNDYEIIQAAGLGIAMGNSVDQLKWVADFVTTDIGEDGIWNACQALGLFETRERK